MRSFEQQSTLEEAFNDVPGNKGLGNRREVRDASLGEGKEKADYIIKDKFSGQELQVLKFMDGLGISEKLLAYDNHKLVFEKT